MPSLNPQEFNPEPGLPWAPSVEGREGRGNGIEGQSQRAEEKGEGRGREIRRLSLDTHHSRHHGGIYHTPFSDKTEDSLLVYILGV